MSARAKGKCPRCETRDTEELFEQDRFTEEGKQPYTWKFLACSKCTLVFMEMKE